MKVLLTGACGFLARILIEELEASPQKHELHLLDRSDPRQASVFVPGSSERETKAFESQWPFVQAEITDAASLRAACEGMDAVIHLAASVTGVPERGVETFEANALGTFVVLDAARLAGVQRVLCASSINAFGTIYWRISNRPVVYRQMPIDESYAPEPEDPYSLSKWVNELTCDSFHRAYGMTTASFRFAGIWSDEMYQIAMNDGLKPTMQWWDDVFQWVHVSDVARGLVQALECSTLPGRGIYTLSGADTRAPEPTMELLQKFKPELVDKVTAPLPGRAPLLSIARAQRDFGYAPSFRLGP